MDDLTPWIARNRALLDWAAETRQRCRVAVATAQEKCAVAAAISGNAGSVEGLRCSATLAEAAARYLQQHART